MLAPGTGKFAPQQIHNYAAIPESCQPVMSGLESHLLARLDQTVFEIENAQPGTQARFQLFGVKRLGQVIIGPGFESRDDVLFRLFGCEQHHVDIRLLYPFPDFAANARSIQLGHHPVQRAANEQNVARGQFLWLVYPANFKTPIMDRRAPGHFRQGSTKGKLPENANQQSWENSPDNWLLQDIRGRWSFGPKGAVRSIGETVPRPGACWPATAAPGAVGGF